MKKNIQTRRDQRPITIRYLHHRIREHLKTSFYRHMTQFTDNIDYLQVKANISIIDCNRRSQFAPSRCLFNFYFQALYQFKKNEMDAFKEILYPIEPIEVGENKYTNTCIYEAWSHHYHHLIRTKFPRNRTREREIQMITLFTSFNALRWTKICNFETDYCNKYFLG